MVKSSTKHGKGTTDLSTAETSQKLVGASTGKTIPTTQGVAISKKSPVTHSQSLSTDANVPKAIKTRSSSPKNVAAASQVGSDSGAGDALVAGQLSHSRWVSRTKVVGHKSLGSTPRFLPPISKKMGGRQRWI